ncbi:MAG: biotin--[acetyl-CoA-carboxylase] ligase [Candidatus Hydrogenedentes bacterium]|nr:biotin--[acetyl-CoA-carboxylase] ligase [Candidatus Hydrogenedentota bacterium]
MLEHTNTPIASVIPPLLVRRVDCVASTNTLALEARQDGLVIVAETQTAGRGRRGNTWHSAPGVGLWFSVCLQQTARGLTFAAALAVQEALRAELGDGTEGTNRTLELKWPNDILLNRLKVCGILVEHRNGWSALGVGINVHHRREDFPEELQGTAGSLEMLTGRRWDRNDLLEDVLQRLTPHLLALRLGHYASVRAAWASALDIEGKLVRRGEISGRVIGVDGNGALNIETSTGVVSISAGEVEWLEETPCAARD